MPVTNYIWDVATDTCLMETDENDATTAVYTNRPERFGPTISQRRNGESHFFHRDALGSVVNVTDAAENVTDSYVYKAYGEILAATGSTVNPFRWVGSLGYYYDIDLLQYYIRARHYDPRWARFLSRDPIQSDLNFYPYCGNNPLTRLDPTGLLPSSVIDAVGRAVRGYVSRAAMLRLIAGLSALIHLLLGIQSGQWKRRMLKGPSALDDGRVGYRTRVEVILPPVARRPPLTMQTFQINETSVYWIRKTDAHIAGGRLALTLNIINVPGNNPSWVDLRGWTEKGFSLEGLTACGAVYFVRAEEGFNGLDTKGLPIVLPPPKEGVTGDRRLIAQAESTWRGPKGVLYDLYFYIDPERCDFLPCWMRRGLPIVEHLTMTGIGSWTRFIPKET